MARNANYLPPLNWSTHEQAQVPPATAPPPPPPRRSHRQHVSHTDGETSGYHSDNHLIDPAAAAAANYQHLHHRRQLPSSRGRVEPLPPETSSVIIDHQDGGGGGSSSNVISARADYKFLERKKWVQDGGAVPYDLYPEVFSLLRPHQYRTFFFQLFFCRQFLVSSPDLRQIDSASVGGPTNERLCSDGASYVRWVCNMKVFCIVVWRALVGSNDTD